jgi:hypothetical protein
MRCAGSKHVFMNKKGKRALHIKLSNALCGILKAALFFHQKPTKDSMGTTLVTGNSGIVAFWEA